MNNFLKYFGMMALLVITLPAVNAQTYDDLYYPYDTETEVWADATTGDTYVTNNYYGDVEYADDDYEYYYSSRIRRFHRNNARWNSYYSDFYIDRYYYNFNDPWFWGNSIYFTPNYAYRMNRCGFGSNWVFTWGYNPWYGGNNWGWGFNRPWRSAWNHPHGFGWNTWDYYAYNNSFYGWNCSPYGGGYYGGYGVSNYYNGYYNGYEDAYCDFATSNNDYNGPRYSSRGNGIDSFGFNSYNNDNANLPNVVGGQVNYTVDNITDTRTIRQTNASNIGVNSVTNSNNVNSTTNSRPKSSKVGTSKPGNDSWIDGKNTNSRPASTVTTRPSSTTTKPSGTVNSRPSSGSSTRPSGNINTRPSNKGTNTRPSGNVNSRPSNTQTTRPSSPAYNSKPSNSTKTSRPKSNYNSGSKSTKPSSNYNNNRSKTDSKKRGGGFSKAMESIKNATKASGSSRSNRSNSSRSSNYRSNSSRSKSSSWGGGSSRSNSSRGSSSKSKSSSGKRR